MTTALPGVSVLPSVQVMPASVWGGEPVSSRALGRGGLCARIRRVLPYPRGEENNAHCFDENNEVEEQRLVLDVVEIIRQLLTRVLH